MLTEPPGEVLARTSRYTLPAGPPGWIDLTTVYERPWTSAAQSPPGPAANGGPTVVPDLSGVNVAGRPLQTKAIYEIHGDRLTYCVAAPGQPRPTRYTTKQGDGHTLVSLRRQSVAK
jgi:hypothetical protein